MEQIELPKVAATSPTVMVLEAGKTYAWCTCGLSQKITLCDGTHKKLVTEINEEIIVPFKSLKFSVDETKEVWLCNCKHTKNPPYCDGSHKSL